MRRDKQAAKKKAKARDRAQKAHARNATGSVALARRSPFGPAFASPEWASEELPPALVTLVLTRILPNGELVAQMVLVDRTCLGVKNAHVMEAMSPEEVANLLSRLSELHGDMQEIDAATARSILFAAIRYAARLGFSPHRDFDAAHAGPPPEPLEHTPLASLSRPFYVPGPEDDYESIIDTLVRKVGEDGFDLAETFEEDDLSADEEALQNAIGDWTALFEVDHDGTFDAALKAYVYAVFGKIPERGSEVDERIFSSLPNFWTVFHWPLDPNTTGLALARMDARMKEHRASIDTLSKTEARLVDVMDLDASAALATCMDAISGESVVVRVPAALVDRITRWTRMFGYLAPMEDGTFYPPATLVAHRWFRNVPLDELFEALDSLASELGLVGASLSRQQKLTRWGALAGPLLERLVRPTTAQAAAAEQRVFLVNLDGERFELHEGFLYPTAAVIRKMLEGLRSAEDFVAEQDGYRWRESAHEALLADDGVDGYIVPTRTKGELRITASSTPRFERLVARLENLAAASLVVKGLEVTRPWEDGHARFVAAEGPDVRRVVVSAKTLADGPGLTSRLSLAELTRALDEDVPELGGRPRDLVRDEEGKRRVEEWLRNLELEGLPENAEGAFVSLDPIRRALDLTVA